MQVRDIMTPRAQYIAGDTPLIEAARKMKDLDCGFLPIADENEEKLQGVVTDRDIVIRGVAKGLKIEDARVTEIKSPKVLYCFETDDLDSAAESMRDNQVYRLVVLDNGESKRLRGIVTLGDISRAGKSGLVGDTAPEVAEH